jgi:hypothetical protein
MNTAVTSPPVRPRAALSRAAHGREPGDARTLRRETAGRGASSVALPCRLLSVTSGGGATLTEPPFGAAARISSIFQVMRADRGDLAQENRFPAAGRAHMPMSAHDCFGNLSDDRLPVVVDRVQEKNLRDLCGSPETDCCTCVILHALREGFLIYCREWLQKRPGRLRAGGGWPGAGLRRNLVPRSWV